MSADHLARFDIRQLIEDYALAADAADGATAATLFTSDGVMHLHLDPANPEHRSTTRAATMASAWENLKSYLATSHLIGAHSATLTGPDRATAVTRCVAHHVRESSAGRTDLVMHIKYDDVLSYIQGRWLFETRTLRVQAITTQAIID